MKLKELIHILSGQDGSRVLPAGFVNPHAYRGAFGALAFAPATDVKIADMLEDAVKANNNSFGGFIGGSFYIDENSDVYLAQYGEVGSPLTMDTLEAMLNQPEERRTDAFAPDPLVHSLLMTVGLPRSGKSTWAQASGFPIVSPDAIRLALHGQPFLRSAEPIVWATAKLMVAALFQAGHAIVILDACNTTVARRAEWRDPRWKCQFVPFYAGAEVCAQRARDSNRDDLLPVIERMSTQFEELTEAEWKEGVFSPQPHGGFVRRWQKGFRVRLRPNWKCGVCGYSVSDQEAKAMQQKPPFAAMCPHCDDETLIEQKEERDLETTTAATSGGE